MAFFAVCIHCIRGIRHQSVRLSAGSLHHVWIWSHAVFAESTCDSCLGPASTQVVSLHGSMICLNRHSAYILRQIVWTWHVARDHAQNQEDLDSGAPATEESKLGSGNSDSGAPATEESKLGTLRCIINCSSTISLFCVSITEFFSVRLLKFLFLEAT